MVYVSNKLISLPKTPEEYYVDTDVIQNTFSGIRT